MAKKRKSAITPVAKVLFAALGVAFGLILCRALVVSCAVGDTSMQPAVPRGARVFAWRFASPKAGDIVIAAHPDDKGKALVKRVVACGEDIVEFRNKVLYINQEKASEDIQGVLSDERIFPMGFTNRDTMPALHLERDSFFLLGDNRDNSYDSRELGAFKKSNIKGVVFFVF